MQKFNNFKFNKFYPSVNEWKNSIYKYNKKYINFSYLNNTIYYLLNSYFNVKLNKSPEKKVYKLKRIFVSAPDIKYTNSSVNLCIYIYNKEKLILIKKLQKMKFTKKKNFLKFLKNKYNKIEKNALLDNNNNNKLIIRDIISLNKNLISIYKYKFYELFIYKKLVFELYLNMYKLSFVGLTRLKKILSYIYNKNININIINIKYLHLDNNIFVEAIVRKLKNRKLKAIEVLSRSFLLTKLGKLGSILYFKQKEYSFLLKKNISKLTKYNEFSSKRPLKKIFYSFNNMHIIGLRIEGKGRLTKRLTASRSVYKKLYKGNLKSFYSSYHGISTATAKGYEKSNINYVNKNSHGRNGSFGIKSWQNHY